MNIIITGSLGNISKPLIVDLVSRGHLVTVVSSNPDKRQAIEALGARAAIGRLEDVDFMCRTFSGADAVFCMVPLSFTEPDLPAYMRRIAKNYVQALNQTGVKKAVVLSGWAADQINGNDIEGTFDALTDISVTILRPASFYSNFYSSMDLIRGKGLMGAFLTLRYVGLWALLKGQRGLLMGNCGGDDKMIFVSPLDIAAAAAEELLTTTDKKKMRYVGSEEMTCNETARIIGTAIGKPYLKWILLTDKQMLQGLKMAKLPVKLAEMLVEMQAASHKGITLRNFHKNNPEMGKVKLRDFAVEFADAYHKKYLSL